MRLWTRGIISCLLLVGAVALLGGCGGQSDSSVAHVAGKPIPKAALDHWTLVAKGTPARPVGDAMASSALNFLIAEQWTLAEAEKRNLGATHSDVERQLAIDEYDRKERKPFEGPPRDGELHELFLSATAHRADRIRLVTTGILRAKLEAQDIAAVERQINPREIASFYDGHHASFIEPERRDLEVIGTYNRATTLKARREVESGKDFLSVARRVSLDPEAPGGLQLGLARGEEEPEYDRVIFPAKQGILYGPKHQVFYYIFKILRIKPRHLKPLAIVNKQIRALLTRKAWQAQLAGRRAAMVRHWKAESLCHGGYISAYCRLGDATAS